MPDTHYKQMFKDAVLQLAGSQSRSLLKELVGFEQCKGEVAYLDAIEPDDEADVIALTDKPTRSAYEREVAPDYEDWYALQTPHMDVTKARTLITPLLIEWGHHFDEDEDILEITDPTSRVLRQGFRRIWRRQDQIVLAALGAATVLRGKTNCDGDVEAVAFPDGQRITVADGVLDKDVCSEVKSKFEDQYVDDEQIFGVISPTTKHRLIVASGGTLHSSDFVTKAGYFEQGLLPDVYGVHLIVHPLMPDTAAGFWTRDGLTWGQFKPLKDDMATSPEQRFHGVAYVREKANAVRVDDHRVVLVELCDTGSASPSKSASKSASASASKSASASASGEAA
jgi:hypothetical protein